ncbi:ecotropic viral integration site 5 protein [Pelomyxa schiedti]|nr:ecotropic viral integration site 5 protein [Pelomyxa schiedti]
MPASRSEKKQKHSKHNGRSVVTQPKISRAKSCVAPVEDTKLVHKIQRRKDHALIPKVECEYDFTYEILAIVDLPNIHEYAPFDSLGNEVLIRILAYLDYRAIVVASRVCKRWQTVCSMPLLAPTTICRPIVTTVPTDLERRRIFKWKEMLSNWDYVTKIKPRKLYDRCCKGIPDCLRSRAWYMLSGVPLATPSPTRSNMIYKELLAQPCPWDRTITMACKDTVNRDALGYRVKNVIQAYTLYDPEICYFWGLDKIVNFLLMYLQEEDAFWVLVQLLNDSRYNMRGFFIKGLPGLHTCTLRFETLLRLHMPALYDHFSHEAITSSAIYIKEWLSVIFVNTLSHEMCARLWDVMWMEGIDMMMGVALAILKCLQSKLLQKTFEECVAIFKRLREWDLPPEELLRKSFSFPATL